jgi:hypothetical protein
MTPALAYSRLVKAKRNPMENRLVRSSCHLCPVGAKVPLRAGVEDRPYGGNARRYRWLRESHLYPRGRFD